MAGIKLCILQPLDVKFSGGGLLAGKKHIAHEAAIYCNPPIHNFTGDRKRLTDP